MASDDCKEKTIVTAVGPAMPVAEGHQEACLVVIYGSDLGRKHSIDSQSLVLGRSSKCEIQLDEDAVSRNHCRIDERPDGPVIEDLGSTNGTYVNDEPIEERLLRDGDIVKVGRTIFKFLTGTNIEHAYHEEIYRLTTIDGLTQVYNKRYFVDVLERELSRARRYGRDLSMIMFDIDHFKEVNDSFGHVAGDHVLKVLASSVHGRIRREDIMARYGGEEFAILLPELNHAHANQFANKIHRLIEKTKFKVDQSAIAITISVGVAAAGPDIKTASDLVKAADDRLYEAKNNGRNRVCS